MRSLCADRVCLAVAAALVLTAGATAATPAWRTIRSPLPGFQLRYPAGWHAVHRSDGGIALATFPIAQPGSFPARPPRSAYVVVFDYGRLRRPLAPRPARLRLPAPASYEGFGTGSMFNFDQAGHNFQAFVGFGPGASPRTRSLALETVASLTTTAPPLANDHRLLILGRSVDGRPIRAFHVGNFASRRTTLVVGCIHGDGCAGMAVTGQLIGEVAVRSNLWVIEDLDPDGLQVVSHGNARGVDLGRDFGRAHPQPETAVVQALIARVHPRLTIWLDQPGRAVEASTAGLPAARRFSRLAGLPVRTVRPAPGTPLAWVARLASGAPAITVELPPGALSLVEARRIARAIQGST